MPDFNVRSDSVNVEQIMEQIRSRVREKRGTDYTEDEIRQLATVKLEKFLDPRGIRSDLLDQFRRARPAPPPPELPNYAFEEQTLFESTRAPLRWIRRLLLPVLKLFFNPNPLIQALNIQSRLNTMNAERDARRDAAARSVDQLEYEVLHNLVLELTRTGIEVKNLKMQVESLTSRLEFNERRARSLESVVVYRPAEEKRIDPPPASQPRQTEDPAAREAGPPAESGAAVAVARSEGTEGPGQRSRRRRRRRGRRSGASAAGVMEGASGDNSAEPVPGDEGPASMADDSTEPAVSDPGPTQPDADEAATGGADEPQ